MHNSVNELLQHVEASKLPAAAAVPQATPLAH
jgi:hypothetical protein